MIENAPSLHDNMDTFVPRRNHARQGNLELADMLQHDALSMREKSFATKQAIVTTTEIHQEHRNHAQDELARVDFSTRLPPVNCNLGNRRSFFSYRCYRSKRPL